MATSGLFELRGQHPPSRVEDWSHKNEVDKTHGLNAKQWDGTTQEKHSEAYTKNCLVLDG